MFGPQFGGQGACTATCRVPAPRRTWPPLHRFPHVPAPIGTAPNHCVHTSAAGRCRRLGGGGAPTAACLPVVLAHHNGGKEWWLCAGIKNVESKRGTNWGVHGRRREPAPCGARQAGLERQRQGQSGCGGVGSLAIVQHALCAGGYGGRLGLAVRARAVHEPACGGALVSRSGSIGKNGGRQVGGASMPVHWGVLSWGVQRHHAGWAQREMEQGGGVAAQAARHEE